MVCPFGICFFLGLLEIPRSEAEVSKCFVGGVSWFDSFHGLYVTAVFFFMGCGILGCTNRQNKCKYLFQFP